MTGTETRGVTRARTRDALGAGKRRASLRSSARLALLRLGRTKGLLALLTLGMLLASTIACTVPLYASLIGNVQLQHVLTVNEPSTRNIDATLTLPTPANLGPLDQQVRDYGRYDLHNFTTTTPFYYASSDTVIIARAGSQTFDVTHSAAQATLDTMDYALAAPHMRFIAGLAPATTTGHEALI